MQSNSREEDVLLIRNENKRIKSNDKISTQQNFLTKWNLKVITESKLVIIVLCVSIRF